MQFLEQIKRIFEPHFQEKIVVNCIKIVLIFVKNLEFCLNPNHRLLIFLNRSIEKGYYFKEQIIFLLHYKVNKHQAVTISQKKTSHN